MWSSNAPLLAVAAFGAEIVRNGRNHMPAFGASLTPEQIRDVSLHVIERLSSGQEP
jgi:mono/diheme cytochrome c family protein